MVAGVQSIVLRAARTFEGGAALRDAGARVAHYAGVRMRFESAATMLRGAKRTLNTIRWLASPGMNTGRPAIIAW